MKRVITILLAITIVSSCFFLQGCNFLNINDIVSSNKELNAEEIYELVSPSVVEITGETSVGTSTGTGFFYDNKGTVITNYHVIEKCTTVSITLSDGNTYNVNKVLGYSATKDIAILSTTCNNSIPLEIRTDIVKTGETVYAIGSSLGLSGSLSDGIVSSAEREIDGQTFIQTTAPISHGNSGGPLLDSKGRVIGITTASFTDGQNLNLAIPVSIIDTISTKNPTTLAEMFPRIVEWISERDFFYYEDYNKFVLVFELADEEEVAMTSNGTVEIKIVNNDGVIVYEKTHTFTESNFEEWTYDNTIDKFLASIYIDPSSIASGTASEGTVYFTVYGDDYYFDESTLTVYDLPVKPINIQLPSLPFTVSDYGYSSNIQTTLRIDSITYEKIYEDSLYIYFSGEKIYDVDGNNSNSWTSFEWKLYDSGDYLIDYGTFYTDNIAVGDKFKNKYAFVADGIKAGENYRLVIVGAIESEKIEYDSYYAGLRTISLSDKQHE